MRPWCWCRLRLHRCLCLLRRSFFFTPPPSLSPSYLNLDPSSCFNFTAGFPLALDPFRAASSRYQIERWKGVEREGTSTVWVRRTWSARRDGCKGDRTSAPTKFKRTGASPRSPFRTDSGTPFIQTRLPRQKQRGKERRGRLPRRGGNNPNGSSGCCVHSTKTLPPLCVSSAYSPRLFCVVH